MQVNSAIIKVKSINCYLPLILNLQNSIVIPDFNHSLFVDQSDAALQFIYNEPTLASDYCAI